MTNNELSCYLSLYEYKFMLSLSSKKKVVLSLTSFLSVKFVHHNIQPINQWFMHLKSLEFVQSYVWKEV